MGVKQRTLPFSAQSPTDCAMTGENVCLFTHHMTVTPAALQEADLWFLAERFHTEAPSRGSARGGDL